MSPPDVPFFPMAHRQARYVAGGEGIPELYAQSPCIESCTSKGTVGWASFDERDVLDSPRDASSSERPPRRRRGHKYTNLSGSFTYTDSSDDLSNTRFRNRPLTTLRSWFNDICAGVNPGHFRLQPLSSHQNILRIVSSDDSTIGILKMERGHDNVSYQRNEESFYRRISLLDRSPTFCPKVIGNFETPIQIADADSKVVNIPIGSLVMEYIPDTLFSLIVENEEDDPGQDHDPESLPGTLVSRLGLANSFLEAVKGLHEFGYIHRDLKAENVCVRRLDDGTAQCVLIDFEFLVPIGSLGSSAPVAPSPDHICYAGTPLYMPDECLGAEVLYDTKYDLSMAGIVILFILGGSVGLSPLDERKSLYLPPHARLRFDLEHRVFSIPSSLPKPIKEWLHRTIAKNPAERPTIDDLILRIKFDIEEISLLNNDM